MRIFSSDIKARYSLDVAPSATQRFITSMKASPSVCCLCACAWVERKGDNILTLQHLDCNSGAGGTFLDAKGSCFYHLTERSPSQWITFREKQLPCLKIKNFCLTVPPCYRILFIKSQLTKLQPVPRELPFVGVVREPFTLLIHRHVLRVQDHRQVARLQIPAIWLKQREGVKENMCETMRCCLSQCFPFKN